MSLKNIKHKKIVVLFLYLKWIQVSITVFSRFKKVINILKINKKLRRKKKNEKNTQTKCYNTSGTSDYYCTKLLRSSNGINE